VLKATEEDWKKLVKLVRLPWHGRLGIRLEANDPTVVMAYVDASFGVHADMRSHSRWSSPWGAGLRLQLPAAHQHQVEHGGRARRGVRRLRPVIWTHSFVAALGQIVGPVQLQQDNLSTMALLRNRSNSSRDSPHRHPLLLHVGPHGGAVW
jgi:hypothetical protein